MQLLHAMYVIEVVLDQELGPSVLLTSQHSIFLWENLQSIAYEDVPATPGNKEQRVIG
jgi:hypothetical protein